MFRKHFVVLLLALTGCAFNITHQRSGQQLRHTQPHAGEASTAMASDEKEDSDKSQDSRCWLSDSIFHLGFGFGILDTALCVGFDVTNSDLTGLFEEEK